MKRRSRTATPFLTSLSSSSSSSASTPVHQSNKIVIPFSTSKKAKKSLSLKLRSSTSRTPESYNQNSVVIIPDHSWSLLNINPNSELSLPLTLLTGQTFRWRQTGDAQFTGVVKSHLISLKQFNSHDNNNNNTIGFFLHNNNNNNNNVDRCVGSNEAEMMKAKDDLVDYLNMGISLEELWVGFVEADSRFAAIAPHVCGARVLRQDPMECLFQFICSSNNIGRISKMVDFMASFGDYLGSVGGFDFYQFPDLQRMAEVSEERWRSAGFGYRAKYVVGAVSALQLKPGGGAEWLESLRKMELQKVVQNLCSLPGIGPKVAACVALFSLDQHHAIPVDTHVWQIATRYLLPELADAQLTLKRSEQVSKAFVSKFGKYAGWAQTLLFISELPAVQALLPSDLRSIKKPKASKRNRRQS